MHRIIPYSVNVDNRGMLYTSFSQKDFDIQFVQDKVSVSYHNTIRGFHGDYKTYKLITCLHGVVKLVLFDLTTKQTNEFMLSGSDLVCNSILVHPGTLNAHQVISDDMAVFHYKWSEYYTSPEDQFSVAYNDPEINAEWVDLGFPPILSDRDKNAMTLEEQRRVCA